MSATLVCNPWILQANVVQVLSCKNPTSYHTRQTSSFHSSSSVINAKKQWKTIERDNLKKIRDTKGTFHAKMGLIKDGNGMDLTEAEDIEKRWQEYTEELYKRELHDQDNHNDVITHLEPDIQDAKSSGPQKASL